MRIVHLASEGGETGLATLELAGGKQRDWTWKGGVVRIAGAWVGILACCSHFFEKERWSLLKRELKI